MTATARPHPDSATGPVDFPVLDTLRFVGAFCVLATHVGFQSGAYGRHGVWGAVVARLDVGVALFFVLSGFLLFRPHVAAALAQRPGPRVGRYYWKRFLRIYPVYAVTAALALTLIPENRTLGVLDHVSAFLLLDTFTAPELPQGLTQMWSLAVEVSFYLLLPALAVVAFGRGRHRLHLGRFAGLVVAMVATSVLWYLWAGPALTDRTPGVPMTWLPAYLTWFAVGMVLAVMQVRAADGADDVLSRTCRDLGALPGVCWASVVGLTLVAATPLAGPTQLFVATPAEGLVKHVLYAAIGGLVVLTGVFAVPGSAYRRALSHPVPRHLGHLSYSIFCLHLPVLYFVFEWGGFRLFDSNALVLLGVTTAVSLVLAEASYRLVERPAQRFRDVSAPRRDTEYPTTRPHADTTSS